MHAFSKNLKNQMSKSNSKKQNERKEEGSIYDKIFRENLREIFKPLLEQTLKIKIKNVIDLADKQQTTLQRETDAFLLAEDEAGEEFILHLEFQLKDEPKMVYRMSEYHGIGLRARELPIRHVVVFLGMKKPKMPTQLKPEEIFTGFELVNIHEIDSNVWLNSQVPEVILLAILGKYPKSQANEILKKIIQNLKKVCQNPSLVRKYVNQLIILSRLRSLEEETFKIVKDMPLTLNIEDSYIYQQGALNEQKKYFSERKKFFSERKKFFSEKKKAILEMLKEGLPENKIARFSSLSVDKVQQIIQELKAENKI